VLLCLVLLCLLARYAECFYASVITLSSDKLSVITLSSDKLSVTMLNVVMLIVVMLNVVMLSVVVIMLSVAKCFNA
jgi:hypothetical protein